MEIYNEQVRDLLPLSSRDVDIARVDRLSTDERDESDSEGGARKPWVGLSSKAPRTGQLSRRLRVRTHPQRGPYVEGLSHRAVTSAAQVSAPWSTRTPPPPSFAGMVDVCAQSPSM